MKKKILYGILILLVVLQLVPVDRENPSSPAESDFFAQSSGNEEIKNLVRNACYDCHSNETVWPWYAYVAPASLMIGHHVEEGREHLNFSEWSSYETGKAHHKLEECTEVLLENEMPMAGYVALHKEADITEEQRQALVSFFKEKMKELQP